MPNGWTNMAKNVKIGVVINERNCQNKNRSHENEKYQNIFN